jgi:dTDP-4-amino-4,6-dideoxygalactose transaminase
MEPLMELARARGVAVIEDCAQAHGATIHGQPVGAFGEFAAFSFCQDKIITTGGEGGLLAMDDEQWWRDAWAFKDHGKSYAAIYERPSAEPGYKFIYESFGTNWRMLEVQAAIGRLQLKKLADWVKRRREIGQRYEEAFRALPALRVPVVPEGLQHAYYRMYAYVRPEALKSDWSRERILSEINAAGVPCFVGSASELYLERAFKDAGFGPLSSFPVAKELGATSLAFLCHPTLSEEAVAYTETVVTDVVSAAMR